MPLPIRDGNQSLTTLSTILVSNAHIPAHTVVSLGTQAITDIATAVSGVELGPNTINALENITVTLGQVTITGGLTDAQLRASPVTIAGGIYLSDAQVALGNNAPPEAVQIGGYNLADNKLYPIAVDDNGVQSVSGTVTANALFSSTTATYPSQIVALGFQDSLNTGNILAVGNDANGLPIKIDTIKVVGAPETLLPSWLDGNANYDVPISGTVTANAFGEDKVNIGDFHPIPLTDSGEAVSVSIKEAFGSAINVPISGTVTANGGDFSSLNINQPASKIQVGFQTIGGDFVATNEDGYPFPVNLFVNGNRVEGQSPLPISGTKSSDESGTQLPTLPVQLVDLSEQIIGVASNPLPISGTVTANVIGYNYQESGTAQIPVKWDNNDNNYIPIGPSVDPIPLPISGTVTASGDFVGETGYSLPPKGIQIGYFNDTEAEFRFVSNNNNPFPISGTVSLGNGLGEGWLTDQLHRVYDYEDRVIVGIHPTYNTIQGTVTIGSALPSGTNRIGVVTIGSGTVTLGASTAQIGSVTASISNSLTISSLPAISGTVTANVFGKESFENTFVPIQIGKSGENFGNGNRIGVSLINDAGTEYGVTGSPLNISGTVTVANIQGGTSTIGSFTSTTPSTTLFSAVAGRKVATVFNEGAGNLHIAVGGACTTIGYQVRLSAGDYWEAPLNQTALLHTAVFATAGTARLTQVS
jgi:hypothetical protein